jgi:nitrogen fixation/metabolism regulation signal transduction histidine kinase
MPSPSQTFQVHLSAFSALCRDANPDARELQGRFLTVQQWFQQQILPLATDSHPALQPLLTEMNRTLRLVAMDVAFLQTARQPITRQQRQRQMLTKLAQIEAFATAIQQSLDGQESPEHNVQGSDQTASRPESAPEAPDSLPDQP